jgi:hypothetical protein
VVFHAAHHPCFHQKHQQTDKGKNIIVNPGFVPLHNTEIGNNQERSDGHSQPEKAHYFIIGFHEIQLLRFKDKRFFTGEAIYPY